MEVGPADARGLELDLDVAGSDLRLGRVDDLHPWLGAGLGDGFHSAGSVPALRVMEVMEVMEVMNVRLPTHPLTFITSITSIKPKAAPAPPRLPSPRPAPPATGT